MIILGCFGGTTISGNTHIHSLFYILLTSSSNMISPLVPKVADEDLLESANKRLEELQDEILAIFDVNQCRNYMVV